MSDTIWTSRLDDRWDCRVVRLGERTGRLTVTDAAAPPILDVEVPLSYGAVFGPDMTDVAEWQERCVAAVDDTA